MRRTLSTIALAVLTVGLLGSCSKINERLDNLDKRVDGIENEKIATINTQIDGIKNSIADLGQIRSDISNLKQSAENHGEDILALQEADETLGNRIDNLEDYLDNVLPNYAEKEWVKATFSTLEQYDSTCIAIAEINVKIGELDTKLSKDIKTCVDSMTEWINVKFKGYYTAAEMDAELAKMRASIDSAKTAGKISDTKADSVAAELTKTKTAVDSAKANIRSEYKAAIKSAIETSEGKLTKALNDAVDKVNGKIDVLADAVYNLGISVAELERRVEALETMVQSVTIVPAFSDGSVKIDNDSLYIDCIVSPSKAVANLVAGNVAVLVNKVKTKANTGVDTIKIIGGNVFERDADKGAISVRVFIKNKIPAADSTITVAVNVKVAHNAKLLSDYTTEFVPTYEVPYVVMKMGTGENAYTLKWRKMNLGATTVAGSLATCAGDFYAWGATELAYSALSSGVFTFKDSRPSSYGGSGWDATKGFDYVNTPHYYYYSEYEDGVYIKYTGPESEGGDGLLELLPEDDAATVNLGNGWRMPTFQEFGDLAEACGGDDNYNTSDKPGKDTPVGKGIYWCDNYDGVAGFLFCDGTNKLFFPAAGGGQGTSLNFVGNGSDYWSSSLWSESTEYAYDLDLGILGIASQTVRERHEGCFVRPVSD